MNLTRTLHFFLNISNLSLEEAGRGVLDFTTENQAAFLPLVNDFLALLRRGVLGRRQGRYEIKNMKHQKRRDLEHKTSALDSNTQLKKKRKAHSPKATSISQQDSPSLHLFSPCSYLYPSPSSPNPPIIFTFLPFTTTSLRLGNPAPFSPSNNTDDGCQFLFDALRHRRSRG